MAQAGLEFRLFLAQALHCLADDRMQIGQPDKAVPFFYQALTLAPDDTTLRLDSADALIAGREYGKAKSMAEETLKMYAEGAKNPQYARAHLALGRALLGTGDNEHARDQFEAAVAAEANYESGYELARAYLLLGDTKTTARIFKEMMASFGDTAAIHMAFGRVYGEANYPEPAIEEFKKAIVVDSTIPEAHYSLGASYLIRSGDTDFPNAEAEFREELRIHPADPFSYSQLGYIAMSRHHLDEAEKYLRQAAILDPHNPDNFLLLGQIYTELNKPLDAETALRSAIAVTNDPSRNHYQIRGAHYQLGRLLLQRGVVSEGTKEMQITQDLLLRNRLQDQVNLTGRPVLGYDYPKVAPSTSLDSKAEADVEEFTKNLAPALADAYNNLGSRAAADRQYLEAVGFFEQAFAWNPRMAELDYNWGKAAFGAKQYRRAAQCLSRYLEAHPGATSVREPLGMSRFVLRDFAGTVSALSPIRQQIAAIPLLAFAYADSLVRTGDYDEGVSLLKGLAETHPEIGVVHLALGRAYASRRLYELAESELRISIRERPTDAEGKYELAKVLFEIKKGANAEELLTQVAAPNGDNSTNNPEVYRMIGRLLIMHGRVDAAIANFEAAARISPGSRDLHEDLMSAYRQGSRVKDSDRETERFEALQRTSESARDESKAK